MYIIIAGGGVVGRTLVHNLVDKKHNLVLIDRDREVCESIYSNYGVLTICGSATKIDILEEAGISQGHVAVGVMREDADNLAFSLLARNFGVEQIMVRMRDPAYERAYRLAGATTVAGIIDLLVYRFVVDIEQPAIERVVSLKEGRAEVSIITLPAKARCSGLTVSEIVSKEDFPRECVIAGIFDEEKNMLIIPRGDQRVYGKNRIFLVASRENIERAAEFFTHCKR